MPLAVEVVALEALARLALPNDAITEAREELRRRLRAPMPGVSDRDRTRLRQRIENLRKQHEWGDITDTEYRAGRSDAEAQLVERVETSDRRVRRIVWTPPARPLFASAEVFAHDSGALVWYPQGGSSTLVLSDEDVLEWYVA